VSYTKRIALFVRTLLCGFPLAAEPVQFMGGVLVDPSANVAYLMRPGAPRLPLNCRRDDC
jgi:hypothetical protein